MNTGELVFMKELSDLRLEWLNKVTEAKDVNPHWDIRDLDKPDTTVEGSLSFKVSFREPIGRRVIMEAYQTVTPESVEQGDFADHGINDEEAFVLEPSEIVDEVEYHNANYEPSITYHDYIVDRTVEYLRRQGVMGASASHFHEEVWYETEGHVTDYGTLETTTNSYHLRGYTVEEEEAIFNKLKEDRYIPRL